MNSNLKIVDQASWWAAVAIVMFGIEEYFDEKSVHRELDKLKQCYLGLAFDLKNRSAKDAENIYTCFQNIWMAMPDSPHIRNYPNWFVLCDVCSEYGIWLEPEETIFSDMSLKEMKLFVKIHAISIPDAIKNDEDNLREFLDKNFADFKED